MLNSPSPALTSARPATGLALLACAFAIFCGGCFAKKRPAFAISNIALEHPVIPPAENTALTDAPQLSVEEEAPVPRLVVFRGIPAKPKVASPPPREAATETKPAEPLMVPELSDEEMSVAKSATEESINAAQKNLNLTRGKTLNAAQQDVVSKVMGFLDSAREAMKNSDWQRARIQAKKAELLSQEFAANP